MKKYSTLNLKQMNKELASKGFVVKSVKTIIFSDKHEEEERETYSKFILSKEIADKVDAIAYDDNLWEDMTLYDGYDNQIKYFAGDRAPLNEDSKVESMDKNSLCSPYSIFNGDRIIVTPKLIGWLDYNSIDYRRYIEEIETCTEYIFNNLKDIEVDDEGNIVGSYISPIKLTELDLSKVESSISDKRLATKIRYILENLSEEV